jgi:uncharacterized membrane protein
MTPPPASGPPPAYSGGASTTASNKKMYSLLAYLLGWLTGIIFLFVGKDDPDVKANAAQSLVFFGGVTIINIVIGFIPFIGLLGILIWLFSVVVWVMSLIAVNNSNGARIQMPIVGGFVGPLADSIANAVS